MDVCSPRNLLLFLFRLAGFILLGMVRVVQVQSCDDTTFYVERVSNGNNPGDIFTHPLKPCEPGCGCGGYSAHQTGNENFSPHQCRCQCRSDKQTFLFNRCSKDFSSGDVPSMPNCDWKVFLDLRSQQMPMMNLPDTQGGFLTPERPLLNQTSQQSINSTCHITSTSEYFYEYSQSNNDDEDDQNWEAISTLQHSNIPFFSIEKRRGGNFIKFNGSPLHELRRCFSGLIIGLIIHCGDELRGCLSFKLGGTLSYNHSTGIAPCPQDSTTTSSGSTTNADITTTRPRIPITTTVTVTTATLVPTSKNSGTERQTGIATNRQTQGTTGFTTPPPKTNRPDSGMVDRQRDSTPAIVGGVCGAAVIFIIAGVAVFILWRRKFRHNSPYTGKGNNRGVTMSSLQNGHPHSTEGTVDNVIYAGDDAGIVDNVIYEGGMGADSVFSNPGYADKTPQFKPRMDVPGAFVQPNPGATNKTPQPQRNVIIEEPQYAQIVDDQYADPQKVRDRKDKKNKKKAGKDKNYADLHGPHEKQPGSNNSNSNHVYQGLNKGAEYQSLRGPREHHEVRPSQVPKTLQDEHDYTSLTHGDSKASAGTLSKEGPDYTVLEGPDSPGEETATGPDYTTLDGPDSPGDEITSGSDYTVLDGPDSPGD